MEAQASLVARWVQVGFIHGVMNTDNMAVSGETIDYGPCAFMDAYDPATVFSSIDEGGRYAYGNQAPIAQWNLARLAETLLPLHRCRPRCGDPHRHRSGSRRFPAIYTRHWLAGFRQKIGLVSQEDGDVALIQQLLDAMQMARADFTNTFRQLANGEDGSGTCLMDAAWRQRLTRDPQSTEDRAALMRSVNPAYIPRNHLVEEMIAAAVRTRRLRAVRENARRVCHVPMTTSPAPTICRAAGESTVYRTFCGT